MAMFDPESFLRRLAEIPGLSANTDLACASWPVAERSRYAFARCRSCSYFVASFSRISLEVAVAAAQPHDFGSSPPQRVQVHTWVSFLAVDGRESGGGCAPSSNIHLPPLRSRQAVWPVSVLRCSLSMGAPFPIGSMTRAHRRGGAFALLLQPSRRRDGALAPGAASQPSLTTDQPGQGQTRCRDHPSGDRGSASRQAARAASSCAPDS